MSKTPSKNVEITHHFIPKDIVTPNKDHPGISKTIFSHISNLHGMLNDWIKMRDKGVMVFRAISALKLHECNDDYYPNQLKPLMNNVLDALGGLGNIVEGVRMLNEQLQALAKLQPSNQPVIFTWCARQISDNVEEIYKSLLKEYRLKQVITENIAHCRDENLIEVYISSWELEPYFNIESNAYLFAEVGLPGIT